MNYKTFQKVIGKRDLFKEQLQKLVTSKRNDILAVNRKYFEGEHWKLDQYNRSNTTTSGKMIWSKRKVNANPSDAYVRAANAQEISFHKGQLQQKNFVRLFTHIYQEYITGKDDEKTVVNYKTSEESKNEDIEKEINESLNSGWGELKTFIKTQVARMVTNTVAISSVFDKVNIEDAREIFPIYDHDEMRAVIKAYMIDNETAKVYNINTNKDVVYAEVWKLDGVVYYGEFVDGKLINESGELDVYLIDKNDGKVTTQSLDELPFVIVPNIDHPFNKFDCKNLEDSEIFDWIDQNDAYNASRTVEFLTNLFLASPKVSVNLEILKSLNMDINDKALQEAIRNFQYSPYSIDTLPIEVKAGNTIPESFYTGLRNTEDGLYESASIPKFIVKGELPSGLATETVQLGMMVLTKKINQKREQLRMLIEKSTKLLLKDKGYNVDNLLQVGEIVVEMPDIAGLSLQELLNTLREYANTGVLPGEYVAEEALTALGRSEDIEKVENIKRESADVLFSQIDRFRNQSKSERDAEAQVIAEAERKSLLQETNAQLEELQQNGKS